MLERGWIHPSKFPFDSPILFVKKLGSLRLCIDYRRLNAMIIKNRYLLPLISELMDRIKNGKYYTKLNLRDAFNQLHVALGNEWKTAFRMCYGHFEYLVMPFGLANAPTSMQAYANDCLRDFLDLFCIAYLEDILIYSDTLKEHITHVHQVLTRLCEYGLSCKLEKCEFHTSTLSFLGFVISPSGISVDPDYIAPIIEWPTAKNVYDIQVFHGFANFHRRFVNGFSCVVSPIMILIRKGQRFHWFCQAQTTFDELKRRFTTDPVLKHFDPDLPIHLHTDASGFAISTIVNQLHDPHWHSAAFYSRNCTPAECNYDIHDGELLAIVECMRHWCHYLEGSCNPVQVLSDHENLKIFMSTKALNYRQAHWAELLANYDFILIPIPM